jgi:predicted NUDIX family NTP pyrophosphohydrolase
MEYLGVVQQNPKKKVHAFSMYISDIDCGACHSNMCPDGVTPEIDKYRWMTWEELEQKTHRTHKTFYKKIIENDSGRH